MRNFSFFTFFGLLFCIGLHTQIRAQVFWTENFNDAGAETRWRLEATAGTRSNPTPVGIPGLNYNTGTQNQTCNNYWIINDFHTPNADPALNGRTQRCAGVNTANRSLHITFKRKTVWAEGVEMAPNIDQLTAQHTGNVNADAADAYMWSRLGVDINLDGFQSNSDQIAYMTTGISTVGRCNLVLRFKGYLGGDIDRTSTLDEPYFSPLSERSILYSINGGLTWRVVVPDILFNWNIAGSCRPWDDYTFTLPNECSNVADLRIAFRFRNQMPQNENGYSGSRNSAFNIDDVSLEEAPQPVANFNVIHTNVCRDGLVTLRDESQTFGATPNYLWEISPAGNHTFVNGTTANSRFPELRFSAVGNYTVTLRLSNSCGNLPPLTRNNYLNVALCPPNSDFYSNLQEVCSTTPAPTSGSQTQVTFYDITTSHLPITARSWNFGAGASPATATGAGPHTVTYSTAGLKTVTLNATNADGSFMRTRTSYINAVDCQCTSAGSGTGTDITLYDEDFSAGFNGWTAVTSEINAWVVNSQYVCGGFVGTSAIAGMSQPVGIRNPNTNYMHIFGNTLGVTGPCHGGDGFGSPGTQRQSTSPQINASSASNVEIRFWYRMGNSGSASVQVSTTGTAGPWTTISLPQNTVWQQRTITSADVAGMDGAADIRIRFRWAFGSGQNQYPALSVDDVIVTGSGGGGGGASEGVYTCPIQGPLCAGQAITIPFNGVGTFAAGNVFTAQLSNATGSFAAPVNIGTRTLGGANPSGQTISGTIPAGTALGTGYRIRVISSSPVMTNIVNNGEDIRIINRPASQPITGSATVCLGTGGSVYSVPNTVEGHSYNWTISGGATGNITAGQGTRQVSITWTAAGTATLTLAETNQCGTTNHTYTVIVQNAVPASNPITGPNEICSATPTASYSVPNVAGVTYIWSITNGTIASGTGTHAINVNWGAPGTGQLRVEVSNACGMASPVQILGVVISSAIEGDMSPQGPVTLTVPQATGSQYTYSADFQNGVQYTWEIIPPARGTISSGQGSNAVSIAWTPTVGSATLRVTARTGPGCPEVTRDTLVYIINPTTIENVAILADTVCAGSTFPLTFITTGGAFDTGNQFRAEFSADGVNWENVFQGTLALTGSNLAPPQATIQVTTPANLSAGRYYYRVRSTRPSLTSTGVAAVDSIEISESPQVFTLSTASTTFCTPDFLDFTLDNSESDVSYELREGTTVWAGPVNGTDGQLTFANVGPFTATATLQVFGTRVGCPQVATSQPLTVTAVSPPTNFTLSATDLALCPGEVPQLTLSDSETGVDYQLLADGVAQGTPVAGTGSVLTFAPPAVAGNTNYSVQATRTGCPSVTSNVVQINALTQLPTLSFAAQPSPAYAGQTVVFNPNIAAGTWETVTYRVQPGNVLLNATAPEQPVSYLFSEPGEYQITQNATIQACEGSFSQTLVVRSERQLIFPNVITPNNDGFNDAFVLDLGIVSNVQFEVFNRWGVPVHSSQSPQINWKGTDKNGSLVPEGVYMYVLKFTEDNGETFHRQGNITVLR